MKLHKDLERDCTGSSGFCYASFPFNFKLFSLPRILRIHERLLFDDVELCITVDVQIVLKMLRENKRETVSLPG